MSKQIFYILPFFCGLVFGFLLIYIVKESKINIVQYPKPFDNKAFVDKNGMKYSYITKEVNCDKNEKNLLTYPLQ